MSISARTLAATTLVLTLLLPAMAMAQDASITVSPSSLGTQEDGKLVLNGTECRDDYNDTLTVNIAFTNISSSLGNTPEFALFFQPDGGSCSTSELNQSDTSECMVLLDKRDVTASATYETTFGELHKITKRDDCEGSLNGQLIVVHEEVDTVTGDIEDSLSSATYEIDLDAERPTGTPTDVSVEAGQSSIVVRFEEVPGEEVDSYTIYYSTTNPGSITSPESFQELSGTRTKSSASSPQDISDGIEVNRTYYVAVVGVDAAGNQSMLSEIVSATTVPTDDFYELYRQAGGNDQGGFDCNVQSTHHAPRNAPLFLFAILALGGLAWTRRDALAKLLPLLALGAFGATMLPAQNAQAQAKEPFERGESLVEIKLGNYLPEVDKGLASPGPYKQAFNDKNMFLFEAELDQQIYAGFGTLALAFNAGYMSVDGSSRTSDGAQSTDSTEFKIALTRLGLVYRADMLTENLNVPLIPVVKGGLSYYLWWVNSGEGKIATSGDDNALGGTMGYHVTLGLNLLLDWFDESSANSLLLDFGIRNSYLFAEYSINQIDDFGSEDSINLSDDNFMFGIAFEY